MKYLLTLLILANIYVYYDQYRNSREIVISRTSKMEVIHSVGAISEIREKKNKGIASWYDRSACGSKIYQENCRTANGEIFDEQQYTIACNSPIRLNSVIELCYLDKCITTICTDRGNFKRLGRDFDLSPATFNYLASPNLGVIEVEWRILEGNKLGSK